MIILASRNDEGALHINVKGRLHSFEDLAALRRVFHTILEQEGPFRLRGTEQEQVLLR